MADVRQSRAWRKLRDQVIREEPLCWLQFPDICTKVSTTGDHVLSVEDRPDLALVRSNVHGACWPCNRRRGSVPIAMLNLTGKSSALSVFG